MYENRIMKPVKNCSKRGEERIRKSSKGCEFDLSTLYACMDIMKPLVQLI
jgi:hypothetical protein